MFCPKCGNETAGYASFCSYCGNTQIQIRQSVQKQQIPVPSVRGKSKIPIITAILIVVIIAISSILIFSSLNKDKGEADKENPIGSNTSINTDNKSDNQSDVAIENIINAEVGDYITFGTYEQDGDEKNGKEKIEWLVLDKQGSRILVISKYVIDSQWYYDKYDTYNIHWETSYIRQWLNNIFIVNAFTAEEREKIPAVTVTADANPDPDYESFQGNNTNDQIFLLSINEVNRYFSSDEERICISTNYAVNNGCRAGACRWWLRTVGMWSALSAVVVTNGAIDESGDSVTYTDIGVRPAMWIELD